MLSSMFESTTIPMLEEVVSFAQARHTVLAGNIANVDTPGYQARDLSVEDFQKRLKVAISQRQQPIRSPGEPESQRKPMLAGVAQESETILRHDFDNVSMEAQVAEMTKNHIQHNLALTVMNDQFRLLQAAVSERV